MFEETLDISNPRASQFQSFIERTKIFDAYSKSSGVVDASNTLKLYKMNEIDDENTRSIQIQSKKYSYLNDSVSDFYFIHDELFVVKYRNSCILVVDILSELRFHTYALPKTDRAYYTTRFGQSIVYAIEEQDGNSQLYVYFAPLRKTRKLSINSPKKIVKCLFKDHIALIHTIDEIIIYDTKKNKYIRTIRDVHNLSHLGVLGEHLIFNNEENLIAEDIFDQSKSYKLNIAIKNVREIIFLDDNFLVLSHNEVSFCSIQRSSDVRKDQTIKIENIIQSNSNEYQFLRVIVSNNTCYFLIEVYDKEENYVNDILLSYNLSGLSKNDFSSKVELDNGLKATVKLLTTSDHKHLCIVTEDNRILLGNLAPFKIIHRIKLDYQILQVKFLDEKRIIAIFETNPGEFSFNVYNDKLKFDEKFSNNYGIEGITLHNFCLLTSNTRILAEVRKMPNDGQTRLNFDNIDVDKNAAKLIVEKKAIKKEDSRKSKDLREEKGKKEISQPFKSDKSPIKLVPKKDESKSGKNLDDSTIRELCEEIQKSEEKVKKARRKFGFFDKASHQIALIGLRSKIIPLKFLSGTNLKDVKFASELSKPNFIALSKISNPKQIQIFDTDKKSLHVNVNFKSKVDQLISFRGTQAIASITNEEGYNEMIIVFDWKSNNVVMAIESHNVINLIGIFKSHLIWCDFTENGSKISAINLETNKLDKPQEKEVKIYSGSNLAEDVYIKKNSCGLIKSISKGTLAYCDELSYPDCILKFNLEAINIKVLQVLHKTLRSKYDKEVIKSVYNSLYPRPNLRCE